MTYEYGSPLYKALRALGHLCDDFQHARYGNGQNVLERIVALLDDEPLSSFIREHLPRANYDDWLAEVEQQRKEHPARRAELRWPKGVAEKVALQIAIVRDLSSSERQLLGFAREFTDAGYNSLSAHYQQFGEVVLSTMHRDLETIAEDRDVTPLLAPAMAGMPTSGDAALDGLIAEARAKFLESDPQSQAVGLERLWDAFERLKSLGSGDKKTSAEELLERAAPSPALREMLRAEMAALTKIGNDFQIRHFEKNRVRLNDGSERDYLFHRLFALLYFLVSRSN